MDLGKRILLVEDDPTIEAGVMKLLATHGYQVDCARDGHEALVKAREIIPSLIVLDAILPKMSGFQVARLLKFDEKSKGIPILMLTVLSRQADRERGKAVGVDLYLSKPFTDEALLSAIKQFA